MSRIRVSRINHMIKRRTIRKRLFSSYLWIILGITAAFVSGFYFYTAPLIEKRAAESVEQLSVYMLSQLDSVIENMDRMSLQVVFSQEMNNAFFKIRNTYDPVDKLNIQRSLSHSLYFLYATWVPSVRQINLFWIDGYFIGTGNAAVITDMASQNIGEIPWVQKTIQENGYKYISCPHIEEWSPMGKTVFSLSRRLTPTSGYWMKEIAIVEIQQDYDVITSTITRTMGTNTPDYNVLVFLKSGELFFPAGNPAQHIDHKFYWSQISENMNFHTSHNSMTSFRTTNNGRSEIISANYSPYSGMTVAIVGEEDKVLAPVVKFRNSVIFSGLFLVLLAFFASYIVARGLTVPITTLHNNIKNLTLESLSETGAFKNQNTLNEFEELSLAFQTMTRRLDQSLEDVVSAKSYEIQARMLALQSKMNPHFLYNTITTIYVLAENIGSREIVSICNSLSAMLRYTLTQAEGFVTIGDETGYTKSYIEIMKNRYQDRFICDFKIPQEIHRIMIFKMALQPIVENCFKYAHNTTPPLRILVEGSISGEYWRISVHDNGPGFSDNKKDELLARFNSPSAENPLGMTGFEGIGLENVFQRLKLLYKNQAIFEIGTSPLGGAVVTIGGNVIHAERGLFHNE